MGATFRSPPDSLALLHRARPLATAMLGSLLGAEVPAELRESEAMAVSSPAIKQKPSKLEEDKIHCSAAYRISNVLN